MDDPASRLKARDIMSTYPEIIQAADSVQHAAGRMRAFRVGCLLVQDEGEWVGLITDRDITVRLTAAGKTARSTAVSEIMSPGLICISEDQDLEEVGRTMEIHHLHRVVLTDRDGRVTGILSLGDLARNGCEHIAARVLIALSQTVPSVTGSPWLH